MSDFYSLLAKHFTKQTTKNEEIKINEFKEQNPLEYQALEQLWKADKKTIEVIDFDTQKALKNVEQQVKRKQKTKVIPLFSTFSKIAAAVVVLIATATIGYVSFNNTIKNTIVTTANNKKGEKVLLADGSIVWLNKDATLSYPTKFENNKREVTLNGEAFFEVAKDRKRPFTIKMKTTNVTVLGTSFNIKEDSLQTLVSVKTGKVRVKSKALNKSVVVVRNETASVNTTTIEHFKTKNKNYLAWKTGEFEFNNTSIQQVVKDINTFYETKLKIEDATTLPDCRLTAKFNNRPISEIIETLKLTCNVTIQKEENSYKIKN